MKQDMIYAVVDYTGEPGTKAASGRWAFKTLHHALSRRDSDRQAFGFYDESNSRVARYRFDGWVD